MCSYHPGKANEDCQWFFKCNQLHAKDQLQIWQVQLASRKGSYRLVDVLQVQLEPLDVKAGKWRHTQRLMKTVSGSSSAISSTQRQLEIWQVQLASRKGSYRLVDVLQVQLEPLDVKAVKYLVAGVCFPTAHEGLQRFYKHDSHPTKACEVMQRFWKHTQHPTKTVTGCTNMVNAQQKLVKQVRSLVGAVSIQKTLMKTD